MNGNKDQPAGSKTLTIKPGTLGINQPRPKLGAQSTGKVSPQQPGSYSKGTVVVVTKTQQRHKPQGQQARHSTHEAMDGLTHEERMKRLEVLRRSEAEKKAELERAKAEAEIKIKAASIEPTPAATGEEIKQVDEVMDKAEAFQNPEETKKRSEELKALLLSKGRIKNLDSIGIQRQKEQRKQGGSETVEAPSPFPPAGHDAAKKVNALPVKKKSKFDLEEEEARGVGPLKKQGGADSDKRLTKKLGVAQVMMMDQEEGVLRRNRGFGSFKRPKQKQQFDATRDREKVVREVILPDVISVQELANRMAEKSADVIKALMKMGMMVTLNQSIDADTAELVVAELGHKVKRVTAEDIEKSLLMGTENENAVLEPRPPVVTVMGHVDHGKTSLLDALRSTDVVAGEAGGITQHIGAYQVQLANGQHITFLDTPGHEAFTAMRSRGARVTDIVVLVVAADDGIMQQTVEAINHAKAAGVPIIVAINKIDKPEADPMRVKTELLSHGLTPEDMGGDLMTVEVSAKNKINLDKLEESILLQAELLGLKAPVDTNARGVVIEAQMDKGRGAVATLLVQSGTIRHGDFLVAGTASGKIKVITNDKGQKVSSAGPSVPVAVLGLDVAPVAGDEFIVTDSERLAKEIAEFRRNRTKEITLVNTRKASLEQLFMRARTDSASKELNVIIKADVQGSAEAISSSLLKLATDEVTLKILHSGVGGIIESDITLAKASDALVVGFNVRANSLARELARKYGVEIRYYSIIYNLIDDVKAAMSGMLSPTIKENILGYLDVKEVFDLTKFGKVAGCYVTEGLVRRNSNVRLIRDSVVTYEGKIKALKRFKEDVREAKSGFECGLSFEGYDDIRPGDKIEAYEIIKEARTL